MLIDGFQHYNTCRCGGVLQHKYQQIANRSNKYIIFPQKGQFRLIIDNRTIGVFALSKLTDKLQEYGVIKVD